MSNLAGRPTVFTSFRRTPNAGRSAGISKTGMKIVDQGPCPMANMGASSPERIADTGSTNALTKSQKRRCGHGFGAELLRRLLGEASRPLAQPEALNLSGQGTR